MKRLPHIAILLAVVAFVAADKGEKKKKGDAEKIQGKWTVVEWHRKGKVRYDQVGDVLTFSGKKIVFGDNEKEEAVFNLRPDKKPRELDITSKSDGKDFTFKAVYDFSGDMLKICFLGSQKQRRPEKMGTSADDDRIVWVLKRVTNDENDKGNGKK
ncbi:MAG: TIGR03067 domain-containing protein [Planctomycetes bacterium]|nr:TIGR03067 domain-containing protein [Planctomycetota bacterium]